VIAPNPHWWNEDAEKYFYPRTSFLSWTFFLGITLTWADSIQHKKEPGWLFLVGILIVIVGWIYSGSKAERSGFRFETRHTFLTLYRRGEVFAHEDMRLITSLVPVAGKDGKVKSYVVEFENGTTMTIFSDLGNFDELISKINGYLIAKTPV